MLRRHFLRNSVAGGFGLAFARPLSLFASTPAIVLNQPGPWLIKGKADDLKLNQGDAALVNLLSPFTSRVLFTGGCVAGKSAAASFRVSHVLARISDLEKYAAFVTNYGAVVGNGMSIANTICFNYQQTTYELEALLPDIFDARINDITAGLNADGSRMTYAHEALLYDPAKKAVTDPFKAMAGRTGMLKRINLPDGYPDLRAGNLSVTAYRLQNSARDMVDLNTVLATTARSYDLALEVTSTFLQNLSFDSQVNTVALVRSHCGTRLVRTSVQMVLGADSLRIAGNFPGLRAKTSTDVTDGTVWHALFQGSENPSDGKPKAAALALGGKSTLAKYLTMQELLKTELVKSNPAFKNYV